MCSKPMKRCLRFILDPQNTPRAFSCIAWPSPVHGVCSVVMQSEGVFINAFSLKIWYINISDLNLEYQDVFCMITTVLHFIVTHILSVTDASQEELELTNTLINTKKMALYLLTITLYCVTVFYKPFKKCLYITHKCLKCYCIYEL